MNEREYRQAEGISRSELFAINKTPLHFKYKQDHQKEDTDSLRFGRAAHKMVLEPDDFFNVIAVAPEVNKRTKAGKEEWELFCQSNAGKDFITTAEFDVIKDMAAAIQADPTARALLNGIHEKEFFWTDDLTGEKCKCRPDCLTEFNGEKFIVDYKTTDSCEDGHFERSCRKYGYKFQAGMYTEGVFQNEFEQYRFAFVAQEKKPPYAVRCYICTPEFVAQGYDKFRELIGIYHNCKESGNWYGYEGPENMTTELLEESEV